MESDSTGFVKVECAEWPTAAYQFTECVAEGDLNEFMSIPFFFFYHI